MCWLFEKQADMKFVLVGDSNETGIFKALGLAVEDLAAGYYVYKKSI